MLLSNASARVSGNIKKFLHHFWLFSGLQVSNAKNTIFFANCATESERSITAILGFNEGNFPMRYLGVPLSSKRINVVDCQPLLDKVKAKLSGGRRLCCLLQVEWN